MIIRSDYDPPGFGKWLTAEVGVWCVANRLTDRLRRNGYECALSTKKYRDYHNRWLGLVIARQMLGAG